jgi:hypothetical protein
MTSVSQKSDVIIGVKSEQNDTKSIIAILTSISENWSLHDNNPYNTAD